MNSITRHDINNQVTILNGYLALAKDRMHDPARLASSTGCCRPRGISSSR